MSRLRTRNPPPPVGTIELVTYDEALWAEARAGAEGWQIDLGLYIEYAIRHYHRGRDSVRRLARWRHEQDMKDPGNRMLRDFLKENDPNPEPEPEYMQDKYAPKSKRKLPRRVAR